MGCLSFKQTHDQLLKTLDCSRSNDTISQLIESAKMEQEKVLKKLQGEKFFDELVLSEGGSTHFKLNGKWYAISVLSQKELSLFEDADAEYQDLPKKHKFHIRNAFGDYVFVKASIYMDAQAVIDSLFGKGMYKVSASNV